MSKQFDPDKIDTAGRDMLKAANRLDDQIDEFVTTTQGVGEPCGDAEPIGMLLGVSYAAAEEVLIEALESVVESLEGHAQKLHVAAANYANSEQDNLTAVEEVGI